VYPSCSTIQENIIFDHANDRFSLEVLTPMGMSSLILELKKVLFHSEYPIELDEKDGVMKRNTSRVMEYNLLLQGSMSPMHRRKSDMDDR
jgi:hypothetical protein